MPGKRIKIPVVVKQVVPAFNKTRGNHRIDGLANVTPSLRSVRKFFAA